MPELTIEDWKCSTFGDCLWLSVSYSSSFSVISLPSIYGIVNYEDSFHAWFSFEKKKRRRKRLLFYAFHREEEVLIDFSHFSKRLSVWLCFVSMVHRLYPGWLAYWSVRTLDWDSSNVGGHWIWCVWSSTNRFQRQGQEEGKPGMRKILRLRLSKTIFTRWQTFLVSATSTTMSLFFQLSWFWAKMRKNSWKGDVTTRTKLALSAVIKFKVSRSDHVFSFWLWNQTVKRPDWHTLVLIMRRHIHDDNPSLPLILF